MNIFFLGYSLKESSGGIENYTSTILKRLQQNGHRIIVFTLSGENGGFSSVCLRRSFLDRFFLGNRLAKKLHQAYGKFDLFLCGHLFLIKEMDKIAKKFNARFDLFVYGIDCWAGRFVAREKYMRRLKNVISISSFTSRQVINQGYAGNVVYLPPVVDVSRFPNEFHSKNRNKVCFLTVGRLSSMERYKGHDKVIEAMRILVQYYQKKDIEYRVVGHGDDVDRLKQLVLKLGLNDYVKFYGFVPDCELPKIYADSDIFIMPSNVSLDPEKPEGEGFGIVFIEAAMYKMPLIGPNSGGSTDIIENMKNGLECDPLNPDDIAEKMKFCIENRDKMAFFGENAKSKVLKNFTTEQLEVYLEKILVKNGCE